MTFPTVQDADTKNGTVTTNSTSWTLTYPTNIAAGDLLLAFIAADGGGRCTALPAGWTFMHQRNEGAVSLTSAAKIADGTETGTFTATIAASEQGGWRIFRITGWFGSGAAGNAGDADTQTDGDGTAEECVANTTGNPNPDPLDPANWATEDTLWFAVCGVDTSRTISVYPLADRNTADVSGGAGGATLGVCSANSAVGSLDPGTFTISTSDDWVALTVAIRPAAPTNMPPGLGPAVGMAQPMMMAQDVLARFAVRNAANAAAQTTTDNPPVENFVLLSAPQPPGQQLRTEDPALLRY